MPAGQPPLSRLRRMASLLEGDRPSAPDLRRAATTLTALARVSGNPDGWGQDLEPATRFSVRPIGARRTPDPARTALAAPAPGTLAGDLAAAAGGASLDRLAQPYRERLAALNPTLRAYITPCPADHPQGRPTCTAGTLYGAALAVKDVIETAGLRTTGGSALRADHVPARDAEVWSALRRAGALCLGKTNTHEFAAGTTSANDTYGQVRNPRAPDHISGGSSGGSAAAVAAGMAAAALGTDTAGSIRIPAACCGVVGLKPTYGLVSREGIFPLSWSLDHVGPLARTVRDAAVLLAAMTLPAAPGGAGRARGELAHPFAGGLAGLRIGVPQGWLEERGEAAAATGGLPVSRGVARCFSRALDRMRALGATIIVVELGSADLAAAVNRTITLAESAASYAGDLRARLEGFGPAVRGRLWAGRCVAAEDYLQAQRLRAQLEARYAEVLAGPHGVDALATPTLPIPVPRVGAPAASAQALLRFCAPFNLVGWPAVTLPCGSVRGLPAGLQLVAGPWEEDWLLALAASVEAALAG